MTSKRPSFPVQLDRVAPKTAQTKGVPGRTTAHALTGSALATAKPMTFAPGLPQAQATGWGLDSQAVRTRMVEKLRKQGVADEAVLQAMAQVPRHQFVESALVNQAYEDTSLPIGLGQTISKPNVVARMIELLRGGHTSKLGRVLEIGTGCGYQAAVLSLVAREVYSIERLRGLHDKAKENLRTLRLPNVHLIFGDGMLGFAQGGPYAGIISAAGGEKVPQPWLDQLAVGARLVAPTVTDQGQQALVVVERTASGFKKEILEAVHFVPLKSGVA